MIVFLIAFWKERKGEFVVNYTLIIHSFNPLITPSTQKTRKKRTKRKKLIIIIFIYYFLKKEIYKERKGFILPHI